MPANPEDILQEYHRLQADRAWWLEGWQSIASVMLPAYNDLLVHYTPGQRRTGDLYDSTGLQGLNLLASHLASAVTNFQTRWFELRMGLQPLNDVREVGVWLDA